ncbi:uncharacterized protein J4E79_008605 [Alternaria viburni]|uniref:uncharacterized protein n=1 Tax=Alternaria viburni TaxID=566460 RepID=UPI0020C3F9DE|nr:uncharacterized protein J4E79_008605 [Alternaria viburni]KAI4653092.1 hypothetical protein J4E79_008605 [Alternaria viburni]
MTAEASRSMTDLPVLRVDDREAKSDTSSCSENGLTQVFYDSLEQPYSTSEDDKATYTVNDEPVILDLYPKLRYESIKITGSPEAWVDSVLPGAVIPRDVPVPLAFDDIPDDLRQSFPLIKYNGSYSSRNYGLHQQVADDKMCMRALMTPDGCENADCWFQHLPPTTIHIAFYLTLGPLGKKLIYNLTKHFLAQYPKYRHGETPKVGKRPIGQITASISDEQRDDVMPTGLMKYDHVNMTALKSSILGDLFQVWDELRHNQAWDDAVAALSRATITPSIPSVASKTLEQLKTQKNPAARKLALAMITAAQPTATSTIPRMTPRAQPAASITSSQDTINKTVQKTGNTRKRLATKPMVPTVANMESMNPGNDVDFHAKAEQPRKHRMLNEDGSFSDKAPGPEMTLTEAWAEAQMITNPAVAAMTEVDMERATAEIPEITHGDPQPAGVEMTRKEGAASVHTDTDDGF